MLKQRFAILFLCAISFSLVGCGKKENSVAAKEVMADKSLTDLQVVNKLAEIYYEDATSISAVNSKDGKQVELTVTLHPHKKSETKIYKGSKASQVHMMGVLPMPIFNTRHVITHGRQRNLSKVTVKIKDTVVGRTGSDETVDLFGYTVDKNTFDKFLAGTNNAMQIMTGNPRDIVQSSCKIDYDHFDELTFSNRVQ